MNRQGWFASAQTLRRGEYSVRAFPCQTACDCPPKIAGALQFPLWLRPVSYNLWELWLELWYTVTPILAVLVYHGTEAWNVQLRFARHLTGREDPNAQLSQVLGRYVPDFEPHFVNLSTLADEAIRGEVTTRMMVMVLKYIFSEGLGGQLDEVLRLASHVFQQPSGLEMVMALLRYISRSAVKVDKAAITQKLLTYLPQEGGVLMETLAQTWIEEGKLIGKQEGIDIGKKEGIDIGKQEGIDIGKKEGVEQGKLVAQRQTLLRLLEWRFTLTAAEKERYVAQFDQIDNVDQLMQLVDLLLTNPIQTLFDQTLRNFLLNSVGPETETVAP